MRYTMLLALFLRSYTHSLLPSKTLSLDRVQKNIAPSIAGKRSRFFGDCSRPNSGTSGFFFSGNLVKPMIVGITPNNTTGSPRTIIIDSPGPAPCDMSHSPNTMVPRPSNKSLDHHPDKERSILERTERRPLWVHKRTYGLSLAQRQLPGVKQTLTGTGFRRRRPNVSYHRKQAINQPKTREIE